MFSKDINKMTNLKATQPFQITYNNIAYALGSQKNSFDAYIYI